MLHVVSCVFDIFVCSIFFSDFHHRSVRTHVDKSVSNKSSNSKTNTDFKFSYNHSFANGDCFNDIASNFHKVHCYHFDVNNYKDASTSTSIAVVNKKEHLRLTAIHNSSKNSCKNSYESDDFIQTKRSKFSFSHCEQSSVLPLFSSTLVMSKGEDNEIEHLNSKEFNFCKEFCYNGFMKMNALELLSYQKCTSLPEVSYLKLSGVDEQNHLSGNSCAYKNYINFQFSSCDLEIDDSCSVTTCVVEDSSNEIRDVIGSINSNRNEIDHSVSELRFFLNVLKAYLKIGEYSPSVV